MLSAEAKAIKSAAVLRELGNLPELQVATAIMAFAALPDEVDLRALWQRFLSDGRTLLFPVLVGDDGHMDAVRVSDVDKDLKPGRFGIPQPHGGVPVDPRKIDFIFIPALAYDGVGHRVGRGGGYYDRFLSSRAPGAFRCGVAFECQVLKSVPVKEHDCHVHTLVTEKCVRRFSVAKYLET
jgi:5-formyltetrahydrofolate cyclo-ligase